jgi:hypothetical protein
MRSYLLLLFVCCLLQGVLVSAQRTYCNPINLDYGFTPIPNFSEWGRHRATADPVIVLFKGDYYLFSTNQWGYWWSSDLANWNFISKSFLLPQHKVYDDLCAPAVGIVGDTMLVFGSTYGRDFPIWMSTDPKSNQWSKRVEAFDMGGWDPAFFTDEDGKLYLYNGSSNRYPLYGIELDRSTFQPQGARKELYLLEPDRYGWQRFGEHMDNTFLDPFMEGAWMSKHNGMYYLQYGAPGTEFSGYADGVLVGKHPLGPFTPQSDPFSFKPGGFIRGAGHGASFQDHWGNWWHVSTQVIAVKNNFERRIGLWPAGFDADGHLYCTTAFGDYPHFLPDGPADHLKSRFTGWMLLNYQKPVQVSSTLDGRAPNYLVDENIKTYWSAQSGNPGEWLISDLGEISEVRAIQLNYADQDAKLLGKIPNLYHQYRILSSQDGQNWSLLVDKSTNQTDVPHDYIELEKPVNAKYLKLENVHMAAGKFALSGFRVFGRGSADGLPPDVHDFLVLRTEKDKRSAWLKWNPVDQAYGYNIYFGTHPDKLYNCIQVHDANEYYYKGMDNRKPYYFRIEAFNEAGVGPSSKIIRVE